MGELERGETSHDAALRAVRDLELEPSKKAAALTHFLSSPSAEARGVAVLALGALRSSETAHAVARLLDDESEEVQWFALLALNDMGDGVVAARDALTKKLASPEEDVAVLAAAVLARCCPDVPELSGRLSSLLRSASPAIQRDALQVISGMSQAAMSFDAALLASLDSSDREVLAAAAAALSTRADLPQGAMVALTRAANRSDDNTYHAYVRRIYRRAGLKALPHLLELLTSPVPLARSTASRGLMDLRSSGSAAGGALRDALAAEEAPEQKIDMAGALWSTMGDVTPLIECATHAVSQRDSRALCQVLQNVARVGRQNRELAAVLVTTAGHESWAVRRETSAAVAALQPDHVAVSLAATLAKGGRALARETGVWSLGRVRGLDEHVVPAVVAALEDPDPWVRVAALVSVSVLGTRAVAARATIETLLLKAAHLGDRKSGAVDMADFYARLSDTRIAVMQALAGIGVRDQQCIDLLLSLVSDESAQVRAHAVAALGSALSERARVRQALESAQQRDSDPSVRAAATQSLEALLQPTR